MLEDPRFATLASRLRNIDALQAEIESVFAREPTEYWVGKLDAAGVPGGPVFTYDQALNNEHSRARNMVVELDHPIIGRMRTLGNPVKSTTELSRSRAPAPWLGQHSGEVLKQVGYAEEEIGALFEEGVIYDGRRGPAGRRASVDVEAAGDVPAR